MRRNATYHFKGDKTVPLIRNNGNRKRVTVCLAITSDGRKLPPFLIFKKGSTPLNPYFKNVLVASNING